MIGVFGRRIIDLAVLFLALYAFAFVPLGRRTGLEHARAILETRAARNAGHEVVRAAARLKERLLSQGDPEEPIRARGTALVPKLPRRHGAVTNAALAPGLDPGTPDAAAAVPDETSEPRGAR